MTVEEAGREATKVSLVTNLGPRHVLRVSYTEGDKGYGVLVIWPSGAGTILMEAEAVDDLLRRMCG